MATTEQTQIPGTTAESVRPLLRLPAGPVDLGSIDPRSTPGFDGDKADGKAALPLVGEPLADLQERLFAEAGRAVTGACCWSSRGWTPPARAGCCATPSA